MVLARDDVRRLWAPRRAAARVRRPAPRPIGGAGRCVLCVARLRVPKHGHECRGPSARGAAACRYRLTTRTPPRAAAAVDRRPHALLLRQTATCTAAEPAEAAERDVGTTSRVQSAPPLRRGRRARALRRLAVAAARRLPAYFGALDADAARHREWAAAAPMAPQRDAHRQFAARARRCRSSRSRTRTISGSTATRAASSTASSAAATGEGGAGRPRRPAARNAEEAAAARRPTSPPSRIGRRAAARAD